MRASRSPDFVALATAYKVAIVLAADGEYPQIADATAPFVYARIMGTQEKEKLGYSKSNLDLWAGRAKAWAEGKKVDGLKLVDSKAATPPPRDVYLYVISGHKEKNPAAAMALIERVK